MSKILTLLSGQDYADLTELFLRLFLKHSRTEVDGIRIFSDGSLGEREKMSLGSLYKNIEFADEAEVNENTKAHLSKYPYCLKLLEHYPQIQKLFHVPINTPEQRLVFIDVDILLLQPSNLDILWEAKDTTIFMQDCIRHAYCMTQTELFTARIKNARKLYDRLNSGIICANPKRYDYALIEELIKQFEKRIFRSPMWIEQSLQSLHAYGKSTTFVDPKQLFIPNSDWSVAGTNLPSALHFTSAEEDFRKEQIKQTIQYMEENPIKDPVSWKLVDAKPYPYLKNFLRETVYRKGKNLINVF